MHKDCWEQSMPCKRSALHYYLQQCRHAIHPLEHQQITLLKNYIFCLNQEKVDSSLLQHLLVYRSDIPAPHQYLNH